MSKHIVNYKTLSMQKETELDSLSLLYRSQSSLSDQEDLAIIFLIPAFHYTTWLNFPLLKKEIV